VSKLRELTPRERLAREHEASVRRRAAKPRDLLGWFIRGFRAELPEQLHAGGVFFGTPARSGEVLASVAPDSGRVLSSAKDLVGGSLIGSPRVADPFRAFIEGRANQTELARITDGTVRADEAYRFPMRAALAALAGRGRDTDPYPFMARMLFRTASMDGDWNEACRSLGIPEPVRQPYLEAALERLWSRYVDEPPPRRIHGPRQVEEVAAAVV
jgi:hypothetical protein